MIFVYGCYVAGIEDLGFEFRVCFYESRLVVGCRLLLMFFNEFYGSFRGW